MGGKNKGQAGDDDHRNAVFKSQLVEIGAVIRSHRQARGWTLQRLADCAGLSSAMVSLIERGMASASLASLSALTECLDLRLVDLFADGDEAVASLDGATTDGATTDGATVDGATADGATADEVSGSRWISGEKGVDRSAPNAPPGGTPRDRAD